MEHSNIITVDNKNYIVRENTDTGKGIKVNSVEGIALYADPHVSWWDLDGITKSIKKNQEVIFERLRKFA